MILDDGDRARLARIEGQLAREEPELAAALQRWRTPGKPWAARLTVASGLLFAVLAALLVSVGWALLAAVTVATGWGLYRMAGEDPFTLRGSVDPARRGEQWWRAL